MTAQLLKTLLAGHRKLGVILSLAVLSWALTGMLHPIMSATQPQPTQRIPPPQTLTLKTAIPLPTLLQQAGWRSVQQASAVTLDPQLTAYRVKLSGRPQAHYYNAQTGQTIAQGERLDATRLALWYTGKPLEQVQDARVITAFDDDYPAVNRLLPVWKITFTDGLRAYIDPSQARLATLSNDRKMWLARLFRLGHTWSWGQTEWPEKRPIMAAYLIATLVLTIGGILLFVRIKNTENQRLRQQPVRRWHRRMGMGLSVMILCWVGSGLFHLLHSSSASQPSTAKPAAFLVSSLSLSAWQAATAQPIARIDLVPLARHAQLGQAAWLTQPINAQLTGNMTAMSHSARMSPSEHAEHRHHAPAAQSIPQMTLLDAHSGQPVPVLQQARQLAAFYTGQPATGQATWITEFGGEYGFINKRLPVIKVETTAPDHLRVYIEPSSGVLAAQVNDGDAREGWVFSTLHKGNWMPVAKPVRDVVLGLTAFAVALLVLMGLGVWWQRRRRND